jgi:hypothetical protein
MIKNAVSAKIANMGFDSPYVEFSKLEVPKSVKEAIFNEHLKICPKNANITEDEIQEMVNEVRYAKRCR